MSEQKSNIVVFGASGAIGSVLAEELVARGHHVSGVTRGGAGGPAGVPVTAGDATDPDQVAKLVSGADVVISAIGTKMDGSQRIDFLANAAYGLITGLRQANVSRLIIVGGAGSLREGDGRHLDGSFPAQWRWVALAHSAARDLYFTATDLDWTYVSPPSLIGPGERTGTFRKGGDALLTDADGRSTISIPDFAIAVADEVEQPASIRQQITFAY